MPANTWWWGKGVFFHPSILKSHTDVMKMEEYGDSMFLRNVGIDLKIHTAPKLKNSTTRQLLFMSMGARRCL
jgi:hypothetical protein